MLDIWHCQAGGVCLSRVLAVLPHEVACGGSTSGSATEPCSDGSNDVYSFVEMLPLVARRARASGCGRLVSWTPRPPPCGRALSSATHKVESDEPVIDFGAGVVDKIGSKHRGMLGPRSLVVVPLAGGPEEEHAHRVMTRLRAAGVDCATYSMKARYPVVKAVDEGAEVAKRMGAQSVVAVGGGGVIDLAKAISGLVYQRGSCRQFLRVHHEEREMSADALPVLAVPTTASCGAALSPVSLVMYEPEEALVPLWAPDLGPEVVVVDPELTRTVGAAQAGAMGVAALSGCFDAMLCASERAVLGLGVEGRVLQAADRLARGLEALGAAAPARQAAARFHLSEGSVAAGRLVRATKTPPVQMIARCLAVLHPHASFSELCALLLRAYVRLMADEPGSVPVNEEAWGRLAQAVVGRPSAEALAEWVEARCAAGNVALLGEYTEEDRGPEKVAQQVASVLDLFEVEAAALEPEIVTQVIELSMG